MRELMLINQVLRKLRVENVKDFSDSTLEKTFKNCAGGSSLLEQAKICRDYGILDHILEKSDLTKAKKKILAAIDIIDRSSLKLKLQKIEDKNMDLAETILFEAIDIIEEM